MPCAARAGQARNCKQGHGTLGLCGASLPAYGGKPPSAADLPTLNPLRPLGPARAAELIAVDWGTSSLRAWRFDAAGHITDQVRSDQGLMRVPAEGGPTAFAQVLRRAIGRWLGPHSRVLMAGMVGSRQGWVEAPYATAPAGPAELAEALTPVPFDVPCWVVPGVVMRHAAAPDVMRGEETQLLGLDEPEGAAEGTGLAILPGTHSKWVWREAGRIVWFRTFMTGELFALLGQHAILARSMPPGGSIDPAGFAMGLAAAREGGGLLEKLFAVRARWLVGELAATAQRGYLSGLLIGSECGDGVAALAREAGPRAADVRRVHLVAGTSLAEAYQVALGALGFEVLPVDEAATARGLWRIAAMAGA